MYKLYLYCTTCMDLMGPSLDTPLMPSHAYGLRMSRKASLLKEKKCPDGKDSIGSEVSVPKLQLQDHVYPQISIVHTLIVHVCLQLKTLQQANQPSWSSSSPL